MSTPTGMPHHLTKARKVHPAGHLWQEEVVVRCLLTQLLVWQTEPTFLALWRYFTIKFVCKRSGLIFNKAYIRQWITWASHCSVVRLEQLHNETECYYTNRLCSLQYQGHGVVFKWEVVGPWGYHSNLLANYLVCKCVFCTCAMSGGREPVIQHKTHGTDMHTQSSSDLTFH